MAILLFTNYSPLYYSLIFLETRYKGCRLTDIIGSPSKIDLSNYDYEFFYNLAFDKLVAFPPEIDEGELSCFVFYEKIGGRSYINRYEFF